MADHRKCLHPAPTCSLFDFQIAPRGGLWEAALHLFYSALKSGAQQRLPLRGGSEKLSRVFISDCVGGAPLFVSRGTSVSEEVLYNVTAAQGRPCPGSLRHALVSSCTQTPLQMMSSVIQERLCQTNPLPRRRVSLFLFSVP